MVDKNEAGEGGVQACDLLIRNAYVITMDAQRTKYSGGAVAIEGPSIVAVGPESEIAPRYRPLRVIDAGGAPVHPGYVDVHYHATMHLVSKLIEDSASSSEQAGPWAAARYEFLINAMREEEEYASSLLACLDMVRNGFTMFMDPGTALCPDAIAAASEGIGIRASVADPWLMDVKAPQFSNIDGAPLDTERCLNQLGKQLWRNKDPNALVRGHVSIYGMGSQTQRLMREAKACADENDAPFNMHQSQCADDADFDADRFGRPAYVHWAEIGVLSDNCVFVHNNILHDEELQPIIDSGMSMVWVPGNTFYYNTRKGFPSRIPGLYHSGVNVTFGVDVSKTWTFGHNTLLAYQIGRAEEQYLFPDDLLAIQTINGARAMGLEKSLGSLAPGKRADLVIRSNDSAGSYPIHHMERDLTLHSLTRTVDTVIVDGRIVVKHGSHTLMDEQVVHELAQKATERMLERAAAR